MTKLLQTRGGPDVPRIKHIEMTGEYPVAVLRDERRGIAGPVGTDCVYAFRAAGCAIFIVAAGGDRVSRAQSDGSAANGFAGGDDAEPGGLRGLGAIQATTHDEYVGVAGAAHEQFSIQSTAHEQFGGNVNSPFRIDKADKAAGVSMTPRAAKRRRSIGP